MNLYTECTLRIVEKNSFPDENGQTVTFCTNYLKTEDGEVLEINSKDDYTQFEGQRGVAKINVKKQDPVSVGDRSIQRGYKLVMRAFTPGLEMAEVEETIA